MGAGKSTALAAARGGRPGDDRDRRADGSASSACRSPRSSSARARRRSGPARRRWSARCWRSADGGAIALGGGSVLSERVREALGATSSSGCRSTPRRPGGGSAGATGRWPASAADVRRAAGRARAALRSARRRDRAAGRLARHGRAGRCPRSRRWPSCPPGRRLLWAASASGDYPVFVGRGLLGVGLVAAGGAALLRHRRDGRRRSTPIGSRRSQARVEVEPGEAAKTMAEAERVLRELARAGMTREDHVVALGGGVVGDLAGFCAHTLPARRAGRPGADHARRPGRLRLRRQDRRRPARGQELRRRLPPAGGGDRRHLDAGEPAARGAGGRLRRGAEDRPAGRRRALGAGAGDRGARPRRARRRRLRLRPLQVRGRRRRRARRRAARTRSTSATRSATRSRRRAATRATATARRSASACSPRCASPTRAELRDEVEAILRRHGLPVELDPAIDVDAILDALQRDKKRTAAGVGFVLLSEPGAPRVGQVARSG